MLQNYFSTTGIPSYNFDNFTTADIPESPSHSAFQELADELELWVSSSLASFPPEYAPVNHLTPHLDVSNPTELEFKNPELWLEGCNATSSDEANVDSSLLNLEDELSDRDAEGEIDIQHEDTILCTYSASDLFDMMYKLDQDTPVDHETNSSSNIFHNTFAAPRSPSPSSPSSPSNYTSSSFQTSQDWQIHGSEPNVAPISRKRKIEDVNQESNEEDDRYQKIVDPSGNVTYQCRTCSHYTTPFVRDIGRHLESLRHKEPSHICDPSVYRFGCGKAFTRVDALKRHQKFVKHTASQQKNSVMHFAPSAGRSERYRKRQRRD